MEDGSKYIERPKLDGNKTEIYRVYYDRSGISFELFLWIEEVAMIELIRKGYKISKAYAFEGFEYPIAIYKN